MTQNGGSLLTMLIFFVKIFVFQNFVRQGEPQVRFSENFQNSENLHVVLVVDSIKNGKLNHFKPIERLLNAHHLLYYFQSGFYYLY